MDAASRCLSFQPGQGQPWLLLRGFVAERGGSAAAGAGDVPGRVGTWLGAAAQVQLGHTVPPPCTPGLHMMALLCKVLGKREEPGAVAEPTAGWGQCQAAQGVPRCFLTAWH